MITQGDALLTAFADSLSGHDPKTIRTYLSSLKGFVAWLAQQPGGKPFRTQILTETAIEGYLDALAVKGRAPRARSQALTVLHCPATRLIALHDQLLSRPLRAS